MSALVVVAASPLRYLGGTGQGSVRRDAREPDTDSGPSLPKGTLYLCLYIQPSISNLTSPVFLKIKLYALAFFSYCGLVNSQFQIMISFIIIWGISGANQSLRDFKFQ